MTPNRRDLIAQWAFDTRPVLGRFHLWLEDVEEKWLQEPEGPEPFVGSALERSLVMAAAVTALGTRLFGRFAEGKGLDKVEINRAKKDADAVSAYALSESLWFLTRNLPENHAVLVSLGEGLMPKAGETPEMGSNPLLGFGRVYARPQVARFLDRCVTRLLNDNAYGWEEFWHEINFAGITVWGAAIDTLENTSRFSKGSDTGPMTVLHLHDQPIQVVAPYEGYVGALVLPQKAVDHAADNSVLISYHTPRAQVLSSLRECYPQVPLERIHVWTLGGKAREPRLAGLWKDWQDLGVHLVEDGWQFPDGSAVFTESGTYAPVYRVGVFQGSEGEDHLWICDGYAASAEAIQAASLDPVLGTHSSLCLFSSIFHLPAEKERRVMRLDPDSPSFGADLQAIGGEDLDPAWVETYRSSIHEARAAGIPTEKASLTIDDFFPEKKWRVLSVAGFMLPDPYTGCPGVEQLKPGTYRVTVRVGTRCRARDVTLTLRLAETFDQSRQVFSPLLDRFYAGQDFRIRPVKVSDSGRIRNELQTLCSEGLEYVGENGIRVVFDAIDEAVLPADKKEFIHEVLLWYKEHHPAWFHWLEMDD